LYVTAHLAKLGLLFQAAFFGRLPVLHQSKKHERILETLFKYVRLPAFGFKPITKERGGAGILSLPEFK
jgi:hypothetical protein